MDTSDQLIEAFPHQLYTHTFMQKVEIQPDIISQYSENAKSIESGMGSNGTRESLDQDTNILISRTSEPLSDKQFGSTRGVSEQDTIHTDYYWDFQDALIRGYNTDIMDRELEEKGLESCRAVQLEPWNKNSHNEHISISNQTCDETKLQENFKGGISPSWDDQVGGLPQCRGCRRAIEDKYYLVGVGGVWHSSCLCCSECGRGLEEEGACFMRGGGIYCRADYQRLYTPHQCSCCYRKIDQSELVIRSRDHIYHVNCFRCSACGVEFHPGDQFGSHGANIYCPLHFIAPTAEFNDIRQDSMPEKNPPPPRVGGRAPKLQTGRPQGRPRKKRAFIAANNNNNNNNNNESQDNYLEAGLQKNFIDDRPTVNIGTGNSSLCNLLPCLEVPVQHGSLFHHHPASHDQALYHGSSQGSQPRQKRLRTSFKHHQLRIMKTYFMLNHNPDAKDLKQLSQKTGLGKRILQVWFQNARAKFRRNALKQDRDGCHDNTNSSNSLLTNQEPAHSPGLSDISQSENSLLYEGGDRAGLLDNSLSDDSNNASSFFSSADFNDVIS